MKTLSCLLLATDIYLTKENDTKRHHYTTKSFIIFPSAVLVSSSIVALAIIFYYICCTYRSRHVIGNLVGLIVPVIRHIQERSECDGSNCYVCHLTFVQHY